MKKFCPFFVLLWLCWAAQAFQSGRPWRQAHLNLNQNIRTSFECSSFSFSKRSQHETTTEPWKKTSLDAFRPKFVNSATKLPNIKRIIDILKSFTKRYKKALKRGFLMAVIFFTIFSSSLNPSWAAGPSGVRSSTGGRTSGSFKPSSSRPYNPPSSRSYSSPAPRSYSQPSTTHYYTSPRPKIIISHPRHYIHVYGNPVVSPVVAAPIIHNPPSAAGIMFVTGAGMLGVAYGVMKHLNDRDDSDYENRSILGPGVSVLSLTVALSVPDRFSNESVLSRIKNLAQMTRTDSRQSVQRMVSNTALELLRQERSVVSVGSDYRHFKNYNDAEREFNMRSMQKRSKFDRETFDNSGGVLSSSGKSVSYDGSKSTMAVIDLSICIEGDSTKISEIKNRSALRDALYKISADAQTEECLLSAEVLWTPDDGIDSMSEQDVYADYPTLYPLFD